MVARPPSARERLLHLALRADWEAAGRTGSYTVSTRGRSLEDEGFIHASRDHQWEAVRDRYYADVTEPLVLLVIDPDRLRAPVVDEVPEGGDEAFPHIRGPINTDAVVQVIDLDEHGRVRPTTFSSLFLREMFRNLLVASGLLVAVVAGALVGQAIDSRWGPLTGAAVGLVVGVPVAVLAHRGLSRRQH